MSKIPRTDWDFSDGAEVEFSEWFHGDYGPFSLRSEYFYGDCKEEDVETLEKLMYQWVHAAFVTGFERGRTVPRTPEDGLPPLLRSEMGYTYSMENKSGRDNDCC